VTAWQDVLALLSGGMVGFTLGLIGGGGSILAVPLLLYVVGMPDPHRVIGTTAVAVAVAVNAATALAPHARAGNVRWPTAAVFSVFGIAGASLGSTIGKHVDGQKLLLLFALLMLVIAGLMLRPRRSVETVRVALGPRAVGKLALVGGMVGLVAGFYGIGGGFLIVPGLILASGMPMLEAVGTSLVSVTCFGLTTAANYALSDLVVWPVAGLFVVGGLGGGSVGSMFAGRLAARRNALSRVFAGVIVLVALYMLVRGIRELTG